MSDLGMYVVMHGVNASHIGHNAEIIYGYYNALEQFKKLEHSRNCLDQAVKVICFAKLEFNDEGKCCGRTVKQSRGLTVEQEQMIQEMTL